MAEEVLFKPRDLYNKELKDKYHQAALEAFDDLKVKSEVDTAANAIHVKEYNLALERQKKKEGELSSSNTKKVVTAIFMALFFVAGALLLLFTFLTMAPGNFNWIMLLIGIVLVGAGIGFIFLFKKFSNESKKFNEELEKLKADTENKLRICYGDMMPLNALFDWNMPLVVMEKATPIIDLDPTFSPARLAYLVNKFGFPEAYEQKESTLGVISGNIQGNPFVLEKVFSCEMENKTYTGSIVITWTTYSRGSDGKSYSTTHTQTLTATSVHPAPSYADETRLVYGNEAAPDLSFTREPGGGDKMDEKTRRKVATKKAKELTKLAEKALKTGKSGFTPMGNDEFDVFFGAVDRDNEVQFRLLFTPLAQQNMLDIITNPEPFGDDFYMVKNKMLTSVASIHSQSFDYSGDPANFAGYDFEEMKTRFVSYCDAFIKNLFFDLAPLLSIPLYQMHKTKEYIYEEGIYSNVSSYEQEVMANSLDQSYYRPKEADESLPLLLKVVTSNKVGKSDEVKILATSFKTTPMVDYIQKMGGDGKLHSVPVHWIKYDKVTKVSPIVVTEINSTNIDYKQKLKDLGQTLFGFGGAHFERGLLALMGGEIDASKDNEIHTTFLPSNKG